jgi:hypothetical protein
MVLSGANTTNSIIVAGYEYTRSGKMKLLIFRLIMMSTVYHMQRFGDDYKAYTNIYSYYIQ